MPHVLKITTALFKVHLCPHTLSIWDHVVRCWLVEWTMILVWLSIQIIVILPHLIADQSVNQSTCAIISFQGFVQNQQGFPPLPCFNLWEKYSAAFRQYLCHMLFLVCEKVLALSHRPLCMEYSLSINIPTKHLVLVTVTAMHPTKSTWKILLSVHSSYACKKSCTHTFSSRLYPKKSSLSCDHRFRRVWSWPWYANELSKCCAHGWRTQQQNLAIFLITKCYLHLGWFR